MMLNVKKSFVIICLIITSCMFLPNKKIEHVYQVNIQSAKPVGECKYNCNFTTPEMEVLLEKQKAEYLAKVETQKQKELEEQKQKELEEQRAKEEKQKQEQVAVAKVTNRSSSESRGEWVKFQATGYCSCSKCCGKQTGRTASGTIATAGRTIAMSSSYAFGTKIEIQGLGAYVVEDRGGAIKSNVLDIYFNSHAEALQWGRRTVYVRVVS